MGRKLTGGQPKPATIWQRTYRAKQKQRQRMPNARGDEWGTPTDHLELVREVMGGIDCDPATHPEAQLRVRATVCYTKADNGLKQPWWGRTFINPPYSQVIAEFVAKLTTELAAGRATEAIMLCDAAPDTAWYHHMLQIAASECRLRGRVRFLDTQGQPSPNGPTRGQTFFYCGPNPARFAEVFGAVGHVTLLRRAPPPPRPQEQATAPPGTGRHDRDAGPLRDAA